MFQKRKITFSSRFACPISGFTIEEIEPRLFSFNSPNGACKECDGLGYQEKFNPDLIIGNKDLTLNQGVILPWNKANQFYHELIKEVCEHCGVDPNTSWNKLSKDRQIMILYGDNKIINVFNRYTGWSYNKPYDGVIGFLQSKLRRSDVWQREELNK